MAKPIVEVWEFDVAGIDPGQDPPRWNSKLKVLNESPLGVLNFGTINLDVNTESDTKAFALTILDLNGNNYVENVRFWAPSVVQPSYVTYNWGTDRSWVVNNVVDSSSGILETSLPTTWNVPVSGYDDYVLDEQRINSSGIFAYVWTNLSFNSQISVGNYGGVGGQGMLKYRFTYDYGL